MRTLAENTPADEGTPYRVVLLTYDSQTPCLLV